MVLLDLRQMPTKPGIQLPGLISRPIDPGQSLCAGLCPAQLSLGHRQQNTHLSDQNQLLWSRQDLALVIAKVKSGICFDLAVMAANSLKQHKVEAFIWCLQLLA